MTFFLKISRAISWAISWANSWAISWAISWTILWIILWTISVTILLAIMGTIKEVQIVYRLFLVNCYLLHVPRLPSQPASSGRGWVIDWNWLELAWQYKAMTRNNLSIIWIFLGTMMEISCPQAYKLSNFKTPSISKQFFVTKIFKFKKIKCPSFWRFDKNMSIFWQKRTFKHFFLPLNWIHCCIKKTSEIGDNQIELKTCQIAGLTSRKENILLWRWIEFIAALKKLGKLLLIKLN